MPWEETVRPLIRIARSAAAIRELVRVVNPAAPDSLSRLVWKLERPLHVPLAHAKSRMNPSRHVMCARELG
jgi:hypothetical protein